MIKDILQIFSFFSKRRKLQTFFLINLMIITSVTEMIGIGLFYPILLLVSNPENFFQNYYINSISSFFYINDPKKIVVPFLTAAGIFIIITAFIRIFATWCFHRFAFGVGADLGYKMYLKSLYQPYEEQISQNSSILINGITRKLQTVTFGLLLPLLNLSTAVLILLTTSILIIFINYIAAITLILIFMSLYIIIALLHKKKLEDFSEVHAENSTKIMKALQEGIGANKEIIIDNNQSYFANLFRNADYEMRLADSSAQVIGVVPRYIVEAVGMILLILILGILYIQNIDLVLHIPLIGTIGLAAQRTLPLFQVVYFSWTHMKHGYRSYDDIIQILNKKIDDEDLLETKDKIKFKDNVILDNISFKYKSRNNIVLINNNLIIKKNSIIGILGESGSGKSTLVDIILCLLRPTEGRILIDNTDVTSDKINIKKWQKIISHVPQDIFISDDKLKNNICLGVNEKDIDYELLNEAIEKSQLSKFIQTLDNGIDTMLGEKGSQISGGQKQRIGIARALYKKSEMIVFDEATNALDENTESKIIELINNLSQDKTIVLVTHNSKNLNICDKIYKLENGIIKNYN